jgi:hypothetical protein
MTLTLQTKEQSMENWKNETKLQERENNIRKITTVIKGEQNRVLQDKENKENVKQPHGRWTDKEQNKKRMRYK